MKYTGKLSIPRPSNVASNKKSLTFYYRHIPEINSLAFFSKTGAPLAESSTIFPKLKDKFLKTHIQWKLKLIYDKTIH